MYAPVKWIIRGVAKSDTIKGLVEKAADAVGASAGVPGLGKIIIKGIEGANNISDVIEKIVKSISDKKPNMTTSEIEKLIDTTKETIKDITFSDGFKLDKTQKDKILKGLETFDPRNIIKKIGNKYGVKDLDKIVKNVDLDKGLETLEQIIQEIRRVNPNISHSEAKDIVLDIKNTVEEVKKVEPEAIKNSEEEIIKKLPETIKAEGYAKVKAAAGYLPFIDKTTISTTSRTGKGGRILKPKIKVIKPKIISQHKEIFNKLKEYKPEYVGEVAGRIFNSGEIKETPKECGRLRLAGENETQKVLARLKARMNK